MVTEKNPKEDLKFQYRRTLEISIVASLVFNICIFRALPEIPFGPDLERSQNLEIYVEDIPPTEQVRNLPPPPPRPSVPVPSESEDLPEDLTIESTDLALDLSELPPPPPPQESNIDDEYMFVPYDEPPVPIGGMAAILENLKYPEIAKKAGLEGSVVVGALIGIDGRTLQTRILRDSGTSLGFEKAAAAAVMQARWKPAKQRDRAVKVWISIPIRFKLVTPTQPTT